MVAMEDGEKSRRQPHTYPATHTEQGGLYVYCIAQGSEATNLGGIGIEGHDVYAIVQGEIGALVHDCLAQPYRSDDQEVAAEWILAHHRVVDTAWKKLGTVLPMTFNTIIKAEGDTAEQNLKAWLKAEYHSLQDKLKALAGKFECGVQVFWDPALIAKQVAATSPEIKKLEEEIRSKPRGLAYMYRQTLERLLKAGMEAWAAEEFKELYGRFSRPADLARVEKTKTGEEGRQMLLNLSCLVSAGRYADLGAELAQVGQREGFSARLAGPFPPYSFVDFTGWRPIHGVSSDAPSHPGGPAGPRA